MSGEGGLDWVRLAYEVRKRRFDLDLSQETVAEFGGPSIGSMRSIEGAKREFYRQRTLVDLDRVLGWSPGTSAAIRDGLAGEDPAAWVARDGVDVHPLPVDQSAAALYALADRWERRDSPAYLHAYHHAATELREALDELDQGDQQ